MRFQTALGRIAAVAALIAAITLVAILLFRGDGAYTVTGEFLDAGQLVEGNQVQAGGVPVGSVTDIEITDDGLAEITFEVDDDYAPLPRGTTATIRQLSLSGIANRFVDLAFPSGRGDAARADEGSAQDTIPDGGRLSIGETTTQVNIDQLFNALDDRTREALQELIAGSARSLEGGGAELARGIEFLNPALSSLGRLTDQLARERPLLERTLTDSARLVTALAERREDLATLIGTAAETSRALAGEKDALAESIEQLPPFMRRANTTFVNLRATLDELAPLVEAAKPVARDLEPLLPEARALAADAGPALRDLDAVLRRSGDANDLDDLLAAIPPLARIATDERARTLSPGGREVNVGTTPGAFPATASALRAAAPVIAFARPYTTDFIGWLDDFSTTGGYFDALGGNARTFVSFAENLYGGPPKTGQFRRCPGGGDVIARDESNLLSPELQELLDCTEAHRAVR